MDMMKALRFIRTFSPPPAMTDKDKYLGSSSLPLYLTLGAKAYP